MKIHKRIHVFHILFLIMLLVGYVQTFIPLTSEIQRISDKVKVEVRDKEVYVKQEGYRKWHKVDNAYIQISNSHSQPTIYTKTYTHILKKGKQEILLLLPTNYAKGKGLKYPQYDRNQYEAVKEKPIMTVGNKYQLEYDLKWQKTDTQAKNVLMYGVIALLYILIVLLYQAMINQLSNQTQLRYQKPYHRITQTERKQQRLSERESILRARGMSTSQGTSQRKVVSRPTSPASKAHRGQGVKRKYRGLSEEEIRLRQIGEERRRNTRL